MHGRIRNNVTGTSGAALSCSAQGSGIQVDVQNRGTHTTAVTGNTLRQCFDRGIFFDAGDGNATFNITATGNTVAEMVAPGSRDGMRIELVAFAPNFLGVTDSFMGCAVIGGPTAAEKNTLVAGPGGGNPLRLRLRFNSRLNMPGYSGPTDNSGSQVEAYLAAGNTLTGSASATATAVSPSSIGYGDAPSCPTPPWNAVAPLLPHRCALYAVDGRPGGSSARPSLSPVLDTPQRAARWRSQRPSPSGSRVNSGSQPS
jgi:hypothetical protein